MNRIKIVIWSGGMDSTLLLYELVCKGYNVWAYSFEHNLMNQAKMEKEDQARKNFLRFLKNKNLTVHHRHIKVKSGVGTTSYGYIFQGTSLCIVMPYFLNNCDIFFGFLKKDCFWECSKDFIGAFYSLSRIFQYQNIKLSFPWKNFNKKQLSQRFIKSGIPKECVWTCEYPKKRKNDWIRCGKCTSCRRDYLNKH